MTSNRLVTSRSSHLKVFFKKALLKKLSEINKKAPAAERYFSKIVALGLHFASWVFNFTKTRTPLLVFSVNSTNF